MGGREEGKATAGQTTTARRSIAKGGREAGEGREAEKLLALLRS